VFFCVSAQIPKNQVIWLFLLETLPILINILKMKPDLFFRRESDGRI